MLCQHRSKSASGIGVTLHRRYLSLEGLAGLALAGGARGGLPPRRTVENRVRREALGSTVMLALDGADHPWDAACFV